VAFIPLLAAQPAQRTRIPMSLRFCWKLLQRRGELGLTGHHLVFHRLETAWPLLGLPNPKLMFLHYAVQNQVLDPRSPGVWRHFPRIYLWLQRRILSRIDQVRSPTREGVGWLRERYPEMADRIQFVPSFADPEHFEILCEPSRNASREALIRRFEIDPRARIGLYVGRFDPQKDPMLLLRAWRALKWEGAAPVLVLVGEGVLEAEMRSFVDTSGMGDRVLFAGSLPAKEVGLWMNAADVLVMTALIEAMSMAMIEALRCGLPVVAPDLGEAGRLIGTAAAGRLISDRNPEAFANAVAEVLSQPRNRSACASSVECCTPERVFAPILALIDPSLQGAEQ
jgi:glycosyltransferase involved in cell wall biosynthesis